MYALCSVPSAVAIGGVAYAVAEYATVSIVAPDPGEGSRVLVHVIHGAGDLEAGREFVVSRDRLVTLEAAHARLEAMRLHRDGARTVEDDGRGASVSGGSLDRTRHGEGGSPDRLTHDPTPGAGAAESMTPGAGGFLTTSTTEDTHV
jgi:hypothetical protein